MNQTPNDMENIETQLRSWALRSPSRRIEEKLFRAPQPGPLPEEEGVNTPRFSFQWLAPATAALMVLCILMNQRNSASFTLSTSQAQLAAVVLSNQSAAAYLPGSFTREANILTADILESTNLRYSTSSISSLSSSKSTN